MMLAQKNSSKKLVSTFLHTEPRTKLNTPQLNKPINVNSTSLSLGDLEAKETSCELHTDISLPFKLLWWTW